MVFPLESVVNEMLNSKRRQTAKGHYILLQGTKPLHFFCRKLNISIYDFHTAFNDLNVINFKLIDQKNI